MNSCYPSLSSLISGSSSIRLSVCIVTPDLLGPVKNGGIGTACTHLAYALAGAGHQVHILFSQCGYDYTGALSWIQDYTDRNIKVTIATEWDRNPAGYFPNHPPLHMSKIVYNWLVGQSAFDVVLFMEWQGHGFYALQAKHGGLHFQNTAFITIIHSPSIWHSFNNAEVSSHPMQSCTWHMERTVLELSDAVISPSAYMLDWCQQHRYILPDEHFVQPNILDWEYPFVHEGQKKIDTVFFFGRCEYRKGLEQFCSSLDILATRGKLPRKVVFMGKASWIGEEHAVLYIIRRAQKWLKCKIVFRLNESSHEALQHLCTAGCMAVMPSVADNSPYTVYECLKAGIPFVARDTGGIRELLAQDERDKFLCSDNPRNLADKVQFFLGKPPQRGKLAFDETLNVQAWCDGLGMLVKEIISKKQEIIEEFPFISVCVTHHNRPHLLRYAVESLLAQDYPHFEVILADDGSTQRNALAYLDELEPLFQRKGWSILRLENGYVGKARNAAAHVAKGDWLLFFDDDNVAAPFMLSTFAMAARHSKAHLITTMFDVFIGDEIPNSSNQRECFLPTGNMLAYSVIQNTIGDTTSLMSRQAFMRHNGFSEDYGLGHEDFELFIRIILTGDRVQVVPESLFWYRVSSQSNSMLLSTNAAANRMRSLRPFMEVWPASLAELALMAHNMGVQQELAWQEATSQNNKKIFPSMGDPNSPEMLAAVMDILMQAGQQKIAEDLMVQQCKTASCRLSANLLRVQACLYATKGDIRGIEACMAQLHTIETEQQECVNFYVAVLEALPDKATFIQLRARLLDILEQIEDNSIHVYLFMAKHLCAIKYYAKAVKAFMSALGMAENTYLKKRPDVEQAVENKAFTCALHHYALHGQDDKMIWPEEVLFIDVLKSQPSLMEHIEELDSTLGTNIYYIINSVFKY